jgi:ankyrin repeat protein
MLTKESNDKTGIGELGMFGFVRLRELGGAANGWQKHRRKFAALYPKKYHILKENITNERGWDNAFQKNLRQFYKECTEIQKRFFRAVLENNSVLWKIILSEAAHEHEDPLNPLLMLNKYTKAWLALNPLSPFHSHYSEELRDEVWNLIQKKSNICLTLILYAIQTYQPLKVVFQLIQRLHQEGGNLNTTLRHGEESITVLQAACDFNQLDIVKLLLTCGATLNVQDNFDESPLEIACNQGSFEIVEHLLKDISHVRHEIGIAAVDDPRIVKLLLDKGARISEGTINETCRLGYYDIIKVYLNYGMNVNIRHLQETILHTACFNGHYHIAKLLLDRSAEIEARDEESHTPLIMACLRNHYTTAELLLTYQANINAEFASLSGVGFFYDRYITLLHNVFITNPHDTKMVTFLLNNGADLNAHNDHSYLTPLHLACRHAPIEVLQILLENKTGEWFFFDSGSNTPIEFAMDAGRSYEFLITILERYIANLANKDHSRQELQSVSENLEFKYADVIKPICMKCANPDLLLLYAILAKQDLEEINRIMASGANPNGTLLYTCTPASLAAKFNPALCATFPLQPYLSPLFDWKDVLCDTLSYGNGSNIFDIDFNEDAEKYNPHKRLRSP